VPQHSPDEEKTKEGILPLHTFMAEDKEKEIPIVDMKRLVETVDHDMGFAVDLVEMLVTGEQTLGDLKTIEQSIIDNNYRFLQHAAHSIKGAALNLGLGALGEAAKKLEYCGRRLADLSEQEDKNEVPTKPKKPELAIADPSYATRSALQENVLKELKRIEAWLPELRAQAEAGGGDGEEEGGDFDEEGGGDE